MIKISSFGPMIKRNVSGTGVYFFMGSKIHSVVQKAWDKKGDFYKVSPLYEASRIDLVALLWNNGLSARMWR